LYCDFTHVKKTSKLVKASLSNSFNTKVLK